MSNRNGERRRGKIVAEYIYVNEEGKNHHMVQRTSDKQFPQSHWVPGSLNKKGHWEAGAPKVLYPYLLPDLIKARADRPDEPVWIAEGEKDCENLVDLFKDPTLAATCAPGSKWPDSGDLDKWFEGFKTIYIIEDNDEAGRELAKKTARHLSGLVTGDIKIIRFPDLPVGGDLTDWIAAGGTKAKLLELAEKARSAKKPKIYISDGKLDEIIVQSRRAIRDMDYQVFVRANTLVEPLWDKFPASNGQVTWQNNLTELDTERAQFILQRYCVTYMKRIFDKANNKFDERPTDCPTKVAKGLLNNKHWPELKRVTGIASAPTMRPDGSILHKQGYDEATGLFVKYDEEKLRLPPIPDKPTKADAVRSLDLLRDLLSEFEWSGGKKSIDESVGLSCILSAVLRPAFVVSPAHIITAPAVGTGKSLLVDTASTVATGDVAVAITNVKNEEEMEKKVGSMILAGMGIISLDNSSIDLEGDLIEQMTERPTVGVRILGLSKVVPCEWRGVLYSTGRNITLKGDMIRRGLVARLDARVEDAEKRHFKHHPIQRVLSDRAKYIAACLTIARAYHTSKPRIKFEPYGSYAGWSHFVREPLIWLGMPDPVESQKQAKEQDPERNMGYAFVELWEKYVKEKPIKVAELIQMAMEEHVGSLGKLVRPDLNALLKTYAMGRNDTIDGSKLANQVLKQLQGQVFGGKTITVAKADYRHGSTWWLQTVEAKGK